MEAAGWRSGLLGTVEYRLGKRVIPSFMSTPEAHHMQRLLREMVDAGCQAAVMEATSHGLVLGRVAEVPFAVAVFTNITRDHLDFHYTPEAYLAAKALLFEPLDTTAHAVVNVDDPSTTSLLRQCRAQVVSYGRSERAMIRLLDSHTDWRGTSMRLQTPTGVLELNLALRGRFHQYNALAAVSTGFALGIAPEVMVAAMRDVHARGRFEAVDCGQDYGVIIDYAHTPDGLENVLQAAREFTSGRVICVFGCGGDRDRGKRPQMGQVAAQLADFTVVTSDNPRTEEPQAIIRDILPGVGTAAHLVEPDRRRAIALALSHATTGDVVVIAGKGHEDYQIIGREKVPFDDREVARSLLQELRIGRAG
jgi:UDP-N-acetylmuramoyl-L-alanyl-D-glutamate--2,6-diaminopimelate ligase